MRLTGSAKSTQKRGAMAPRRTHYPQILFLEKKDPWGTVSGLENPLPFLGYLSHSVLYRISKCAHLCNNGMFAPIWWGVFFGITANPKVLSPHLTHQLKNTFPSFLYTSEFLVVSVLHFMSESYFCPLNSKFCANKVHYGKCASSVLATVILDSVSGAYRKEKGRRGWGLLRPLQAASRFQRILVFTPKRKVSVCFLCIYPLGSVFEEILMGKSGVSFVTCVRGASVTAHLETKTGDCMKISLLPRTKRNQNGWRKWIDKKERKMKDGDNYIVALPVTSLLPAQPEDTAFNISNQRINILFSFFPRTIKDWSLIPSTIKAERYSSFCNYLIFNF